MLGYCNVNHVEMQSDLCEAIFQRAAGLAGNVCWETDLLALFKRPRGDPVEVSVADSTTQAASTGKRNKTVDCLFLADMRVCG